MNFRVSASDFIFEKTAKLRDVYKISKKVGEGAFSSVRRIKHRVTGEKRAVKTIHKKSLRTEEEKAMFFNEVAILRAVDHPNIIKLHEYYQDELNYYIITEYCGGGELFERILSHGNISESTAAEYMRQIFGILVYLEEKNIAHKDLKPENFLLSSTSDEAYLKLIDFGSSAFYAPGEIMTSKVGTPYYISPEVLKKQYNYKCDIWSAAIMMYILLCGYPPFGGNKDQEILKKVSIGRFSFPSPEWDDISFEAKDLIEKCLCVDVTRRPDARQALGHPWITNASKAPLNRNAASHMFNNLRGFRSEQMLKKAAIGFITSQMATKSEREEMMELFRSLDTDNSGTLSTTELKEGFVMLFGNEISDIDSEVERIMKQVDLDGSGEIEYSEFVSATLNRQQLLSKERLEMAFKAFDLDGSGTITANELKQVLGKSHNYDDEVWEKLVAEADLNGDGVIDLSEFTKMMLSVL
jgi:calcium-dependent protein kinase